MHTNVVPVRMIILFPGLAHIVGGVFMQNRFGVYKNGPSQTLLFISFLVGNVILDEKYLGNLRSHNLNFFVQSSATFTGLPSSHTKSVTETKLRFAITRLGL